MAKTGLAREGDPLDELIEVIDARGRVLSPCQRKVAEREVRLQRAKWIGRNRIRLRFDPFAYRYIRLKVLARDRYICYWCSGAGDTIDHIIPWSRGGRTTMTNCVTACQDCNGQRGDTPAEEFARAKGVAMPRFTGNEPVPKVVRRNVKGMGHVLHRARPAATGAPGQGPAAPPPATVAQKGDGGAAAGKTTAQTAGGPGAKTPGRAAGKDARRSRVRTAAQSGARAPVASPAPLPVAAVPAAAVAPAPAAAVRAIPVPAALPEPLPEDGPAARAARILRLARLLEGDGLTRRQFL